MGKNQTKRIAWIGLAIVGIAAGSLMMSTSEREQDRLKGILDRWRAADRKTDALLKRGDKMEIREFEDEYHENLAEMQEAQDDFSELSAGMDNKKLKKDAQLCNRGISKIRMAVWTYGSYVQLYLERKQSGDAQLAKDAKRKKDRESVNYRKGRQVGQELVKASGL